MTPPRLALANGLTQSLRVLPLRAQREMEESERTPREEDVPVELEGRSHDGENASRHEIVRARGDPCAVRGEHDEDGHPDDATLESPRRRTAPVRVPDHRVDPDSAIGDASPPRELQVPVEPRGPE